jgi:glycerol uptake facilitator-like aquaporin
LTKRLAAEFLGTMLLLAAVVGSGIMAERLAGGNVALALLANAVATGAALAVLIALLAPLSGAHFNPVVTLVFALHREISASQAAGYAASQIVGAVTGVWLAHAMFALPLLEISHKLRAGTGQAISEAVATFGLVLTILGTAPRRPDAVPILVGLYITSAYWFTASTSFANPAMTVARVLSDTFAGIAPASAPAFIAAQVCGALLAAATSRWLFAETRQESR